MLSTTSATSLTLWKRPILWMPAVVAVAVYWDPVALRGPFVYDDVASILNNDVVMVKVPWYEAFTRDFWGQPMVHPASHKSYRPITTLTLMLNMILSLVNGTAGTPDHTYYFHVVNVILHGINTGLLTEVSSIVFNGLGSDCNNNYDDAVFGAPLVAGILFGIHPVHAEAVSNITSRGELLMTLFFSLSFLCYVKYIPQSLMQVSSNTTNQSNISKLINNDEDSKNENNMTINNSNLAEKKKGKKTVPWKNDSTSNEIESHEAKSESTNETSTIHKAVFLLEKIKVFLFIYVFPCLFMALSLFSKEQGATTLCTLVAFDFIKNHHSIQSFYAKLRNGNSYTWDFLERSLILAMQTFFFVGLRYWLNGESSPDFVYEQNPAGFTKDRFTRIFSVNWTYCLYLRDMAFPLYLAPDWSGHGIPLIESMKDNRAYFVVMLWCATFICMYSLYRGSPPNTSKQCKEIRQVILISLIAFLFLPFLLSSNLLVVVGLMKADRVIYLPLFGYCLIKGLLFKIICSYTGGYKRPLLAVVYVIFILEFAFFAHKVNERNLAWADEYTLWVKAYQVNPRSFHTLGNVGRMLAKAGEYVEAEKAMRPIKDVRTNEGNPNDTFLYTVALSKLERCEEAFPLIDDAIEFIHEEREKGGIRYDAKMSFHSESSLMISRAFCTSDVMEKGRIMKQAVSLDPQNDFARGQFHNYLETLQKMQEQMQMQIQQSRMSPEQMQAMQRRMMELQQGATPTSEAELQAMRQFFMLQQQMQQVQQIRQHQQQLLQPPPQNLQAQANTRDDQNKAAKEGEIIPHNFDEKKRPGTPSLPPIKDFENEAYGNMFYN